MRRLVLALGLACLATPCLSGETFPDRYVWVFGWGLNRDDDVTEITKVLDTAADHGLNGAVVSFGLDTLCKQSPDYFRRLDAIRSECERTHLELIPSIFSVGYGGAALTHDQNLAEGLPVEDAPFVVRGSEARLAPDDTTRIRNGDFEASHGNQFEGFAFHDEPGKISFVDHDVHHGGKASIRLENFTANQYGHGRVSQEIKLTPHRCYRLSFWAKTEDLQPAGAFRVTILTKDSDRELAPRTFNVPATSDWRKISTIFNSLDNDSARLYMGVWGGKSGKFWLDDCSLEEIGPLNVLHRPGTPVTVRSEDGKTTYTEGQDYAPLKDPNFRLWNTDRDAAALKILPGGRIRDGQHLKVIWYHPMLIYDSQIAVCMAEPALYEYFDHEAGLLAEKVHPRRVLLNMDEIRMGGTCEACRGRDMGELLGECITRQVEILRRHMPDVEVMIWSDMLDPSHNAHGNYYLVKGDYTGSWTHVPKDLIMAVWSGEPRPRSMQFFSEQGFRTLAACYYDADNLDEVKAWVELVKKTPHAQGLMYTPWQKKYGLLPEFGDLLKNP